ncbi:hypothetical protein [cyanobacterium endosymbiont of Rhopalodia gibberula]|uniref:hypothetical protein n=1 Tax=cyanobacterium endosymbiont of Rhopalodia gibberula TaxID=1763363 RepID=UPI0015596909|nr:hypothetical protein [cyanobacterium endosymbiont of Rhopalodia gibberula]
MATVKAKFELANCLRQTLRQTNQFFPIDSICPNDVTINNIMAIVDTKSRR